MRSLSGLTFCVVALAALTLGLPGEADAACWKCRNTTCKSYDTGSTSCTYGKKCTWRCVNFCQVYNDSCTGGCAGETSEDGECEAPDEQDAGIMSNDGVILTLNGDVLPPTFPPRHRFESTPAHGCGTQEEAQLPVRNSSSRDLTLRAAEG